VNDMPPLPRLLAFYQDSLDEDIGVVWGWRPVAWGLELADTTLTVPVETPVRVTLWHSVNDAAEAFDAVVATIDTRLSLTEAGR
jgi:hypothetical protein